jgi:hypothetical protein
MFYYAFTEFHTRYIYVTIIFIQLFYMLNSQHYTQYDTFHQFGNMFNGKLQQQHYSVSEEWCLLGSYAVWLL